MCFLRTRLFIDCCVNTKNQNIKDTIVMNLLPKFLQRNQNNLFVLFMKVNLYATQKEYLKLCIVKQILVGNAKTHVRRICKIRCFHEIFGNCQSSL